MNGPPAEERRASGFFGGEARSASSDEAVPLSDFIHPRYLRVWILLAWLRLTTLLPLRWSLATHKLLGRGLRRIAGRARRTVEKNLALCFPELSKPERRRLAAACFANMGACVPELALAWFHPMPKLRGLFEIDGVEHLEAACSQGRGVILCAGHFTTMEICSVGVSFVAPNYTVLYNKRRSRLLSEIQRRGRDRYASDSIEKREVRRLVRRLRENAVVWISADEVHTGKSSARLPFFGVPALTNTSLSRLAGLSGALVVPLAFQRKPDNSGYRIRFDPALDDFPSDDPNADTARLVAVLEAQIRECPAQYFWKQNRFRKRRSRSRD